MPLDPSIYDVIKPLGVGAASATAGRTAEEMALAQERQEKIRQMREDSIDQATVNAALQRSVDPATGQPDLDNFLGQIAQSGRTTAFEKATKIVDTHRLQVEQAAKEHAAGMESELKTGMGYLALANEDNWPMVRKSIVGLASDPATAHALDAGLPQQYDEDQITAMASRFEKPLDYYKAVHGALDKSPNTLQEILDGTAESLQHATVGQQWDDVFNYAKVRYGGQTADYLRSQFGEYSPENVQRAATMTPEARGTDKALTPFQTKSLEHQDIVDQRIQDNEKRLQQNADRDYALRLKEMAAKQTDDVTSKFYNASKVRLDALRKPVEDTLDKFVGLSDMINQKTPQADALIAPKLLSVTVGGMGTGLRMTQSEIDRTVGGRSNWEQLKAALNKWQADPSKALSITDSQRNQIRALVAAVGDKATSKIQLIQKADADLLDAKSVDEQRRIIVGLQKNVEDVTSGGQTAAVASGSKIVSTAELQAIAKRRGTTVEQERQRYINGGYTVK